MLGRPFGRGGILRRRDRLRKWLALENGHGAIGSNAYGADHKSGLARGRDGAADSGFRERESLRHLDALERRAS